MGAPSVCGVGATEPRDWPGSGARRAADDAEQSFASGKSKACDRTGLRPSSSAVLRSSMPSWPTSSDCTCTPGAGTGVVR